jgi:hypothetical protein
MPSRPIHVVTSTPAGAGYAFYKAHNQNDLNNILEAAGGAFGGYFGGILPDLLDPPLHPGHRALAHGFLPVAAGAAVWNQGLDGWQAGLRQLANEQGYRRSQSTDPIAAAWYAFAEWALRLLSGFLAGFGAGYITHVALDFRTPCCLPLIS